MVAITPQCARMAIVGMSSMTPKSLKLVSMKLIRLSVTMLIFSFIRKEELTSKIFCIMKRSKIKSEF